MVRHGSKGQVARQSERGEVGEDERVGGQQAIDALGVHSSWVGHPLEKSQAGRGRPPLSLERDHRGLDRWRGLENRKDLGWALEREG